MCRHPCLSPVSMEIYFFPYFYMWLVTVLCRHPCLSPVSVGIYFSCASMVGWWQYSIGMEIYFFSLPLCVAGILVWCCEGCWNILSCGNLFFPVCSLGIYFSSTLVRLCHFSDPLLHVSDICNTSLVEAITEDFMRYSLMHTFGFSLVILTCYSSSWICVCDDLRKCI